MICRDSYKSKPGCIVRTDYLAFLRVLSENPGLNRYNLMLMATGGKATPAKVRRIDELTEAGLISETRSIREYSYEITETGIVSLKAAEGALREMGQ